MKIVITALSLLLITNLGAEETLLQTYQRELAFLSAQKRTLEKQQKDIETEFGNKVSKMKVDLKAAQDQLVRLSKKNELQSAKLIEAERNLENVENSNSLLETTLIQGKVTLNINDQDWKEIKTQEEKIQTILKGAVALLEIGGKVEVTREEFFNQRGALVKGDMLKIGRIASYGVTPVHTSMLMPVGLGKLKLTEMDLAEEIKLLRKGDEIPSLPIFLYENTSKGIEPKKDKSFYDIVEAGGAIAYVIVGLGLIALLLAFVRGFLLYGASRFDKALLTSIKDGNLELVKEKTLKGATPFDRVLSKTLIAKDKEREARENVIHESILGELNHLDKFGAVILVMAAVAPLLGLLGTVTGMISTFDIITEFGTGDPKLLSSGISEALITTKLGLVVAIPSLLLGNLLSGWSGKIKVMLEREALRLSNLFDKEA